MFRNVLTSQPSDVLKWCKYVHWCNSWNLFSLGSGSLRRSWLAHLIPWSTAKLAMENKWVESMKKQWSRNTATERKKPKRPKQHFGAWICHSICYLQQFGAWVSHFHVICKCIGAFTSQFYAICSNVWFCSWGALLQNISKYYFVALGHWWCLGIAFFLFYWFCSHAIFSASVWLFSFNMSVVVCTMLAANSRLNLWFERYLRHFGAKTYYWYKYSMALARVCSTLR